MQAAARKMRESARESKSWEGSGRGGPNGPPLRRNSGASRGFNSGGLHPEDSTAISTIIEQMRSGGSAGRRLATAQVRPKGVALRGKRLRLPVASST